MGGDDQSCVPAYRPLRPNHASPRVHIGPRHGRGGVLGAKAPSSFVEAAVRRFADFPGDPELGRSGDATTGLRSTRPLGRSQRDRAPRHPRFDRFRVDVDHRCTAVGQRARVG